MSNKIASRVARLQKLATSDNVNEAFAAAEQARKLMIAHAISQVEVDAILAAAEDPLIERHLYIEGLRLVPFDDVKDWAGKTAGWKRKLAINVARYMACRCAFVVGRGSIFFYGHTSDVEAAIKLFNICAKQIDRTCNAFLREEQARRTDGGRLYWKWDRGIGRTEGTAYKESAVLGLKAKFDDLARESAEENAEGNALVLSRAQKVEDWVNANYTFKKSNQGLGGQVDLSPSSFEAGFNAGKSMRLTEDDGVASADRKALPG